MSTKRQKIDEFDREMMKRALRAAVNGHPFPNPHVGAVLAKAGNVISVGYHARCGGPHAEVVAIQRAKNKTRGATLFVTFEPCNHYGRTGPCTEAIIAAGIKRVVIGCRDPAPHKPGAIKRLRCAGIETVVGVFEDRAQELVKDFTKFLLEGMPLTTLKAAVTLDGRLASRIGDSKWISGEKARREAHRLRAQNSAVMVGIGTVLADDPQLTVREVRGRHPIRVILDSHLRTPSKSRVLSRNTSSPVLIFHSSRVKPTQKAKYQHSHVELVPIEKNRGGGLNLSEVMKELARRNIVRLLVEGGARIHGSLLDSGLADCAAIFVAPRIIGDAHAIPLADGRGHKLIMDAWRLERVQMRRFEDDILIRGDLKRTK